MVGLSCICNYQEISLVEIPPQYYFYFFELLRRESWVRWRSGTGWCWNCPGSPKQVLKNIILLEIFFSTKAKALLTWGWPCVRCPVQERFPPAQTASTGGPRSLQLGGRTTPSGENGVSTSGDNKGWWQQRPASSRLCPQCECWKAGCQGWGETGYWWLWKEQRQQNLDADFVLAAAFTRRKKLFLALEMLRTWSRLRCPCLIHIQRPEPPERSSHYQLSFFLSFLSSSKCVSWLSWQLS